MLNINFVPDDYVQKRQSHRANIFYLVLLLLVLSVFGGTFLVIKARQRAVSSQAKLVNARMAKAGKAIASLEELQTKRRLMMKTALMTAELVDTVPRSLILATLTNTLVPGVSLTRVKLIEKAPIKVNSGQAHSSRYDALKGGQGQAQEQRENRPDIYIEIEGIAPSDIELAGYIARLDNSILLEDVELVHSKEAKIDEEKFRAFELTAMLKKDVRITKGDITSIKPGRSK